MRRLLLLTIVFLKPIFSQLYAQNVYISSSDVYLDSNPVVNGVTQSVTANPTLSMKLRNVGNETYNGLISLGVLVSNDSVSNFLTQYNDTSQINQLSSNDSVLISFGNFGYSNPNLNLSIGGNVVVVWPKGTNGTNTIQAVDTVTFLLSITDTLSLADARKYESRYVLYPNPSTEYVYLKRNENNNAEIEKIDIYSAIGKLETRVKEPNERISIAELSTGYYNVVVYTRTKEVLRLKILKK